MEIQKRVGVWIRVSTDRQVDSESPEHHEERARYYAKAKDWNIVEVYRLDAMTGKSIMEYPETKRMLKDIRSGHITGLIFSKLARLARNTRELLDLADMFKENNADLISLAEAIDTSTPAGRLFYTIIAAMATWEREEISARVAASVPVRAMMGKPLGGAAPYGYKWEGKELQPDEKESSIRKLLHELFVKMKRKKAVASELNKLGYRTRNGSKFSDTTIDRLLRDPTAKGQRIANYTKSLGEGKKWVVKPKEDWVIVPCLPIISEELWTECNHILETQTAKRKQGPRPVHLLSGYVTCTCGKKMYVYHEKTATFRCKPCKISIPSNDLDEIYYGQLKSFLLTDVDVSEYMAKSDTLLKEKEALLDQSKKESTKMAKRMSDLVNLKLDGDLTKEAFQREYKPLDERYNQLEKQLPELEAEVDFLKIQYLSSDTIRQEAQNLYDRWPQLQFEEKRGIIELITENITINKSDISISLSYLPTPHTPHPSQNSGNRQRNYMDS